jgi:hypothetical protein
MENDRVETGVDRLIETLNDGKKHFVDDLSRKIDVPSDILQLWIDFLVEEKVISLEYTFTKAYIFLNKEVPKILRQDKLETLEDLKKNFIEDGLLKKIPMNNLLVFWRNSLDDNLNKLQEKFYREANKRKLKAVDSMWARYKQKLYEV